MTTGELRAAWVDLIIVLAIYGVRPMVMLNWFPATDEPLLSARARFQLGLALAFYASFGVPAAPFKNMDATLVVLMLAREAMIGGFLALVAGKVFWVAQSAGALIDNLAGFNNIQLLNPSSAEQSTPLSDLLLQLTGGLFLVSGGLVVLTTALFESWRWWPPLQPGPGLPDAYLSPTVVGQGVASLMRIVTMVAMPILFLLVLVDLGFALVSRAAKGVDTAAASTPVRAATALFSFTIMAAVFLDELKGALHLPELFAIMRRLAAQ